MFSLLERSSGGITVQPPTRPVLFYGLVYAALLLIPAWALLAKTDWFTRAIAGMSRERDLTETENLEL